MAEVVCPGSCPGLAPRSDGGTGTWAWQGLWGRQGRAEMGCGTQAQVRGFQGTQVSSELDSEKQERVSISSLFYLGPYTTAAN